MKKRGGKKRETKPGRRERTFNQIDKQLNDWENAGIQLLLTVRYEYFLMLFIVGQLVRRKGLGYLGSEKKSFQSPYNLLNSSYTAWDGRFGALSDQPPPWGR